MTHDGKYGFSIARPHFKEREPHFKERERDTERAGEEEGQSVVEHSTFLSSPTPQV